MRGKIDFFKGKKILVAGGAGFIGTNFIKVLVKRGANVAATCHRRPPQAEDSEIKYFCVDLMDRRDCARVVQNMDYVFMCAANTSGAGVIEKTPLVHITPNVVMNALMLEAAYTAGVKKYLWISSSIVYPVTDYSVKEEQMMSGPPFDKYYGVAWMKRFGEILCETYSTKIKNPMKTVVVRPANIYGEYDDFELETSHVVPALIRKVAEHHNPVEVWGDGNEVKDLIYIGDFIEGALLAMEKIDDFRPLNIATGTPVTVKEVVTSILEADNYKNAVIVFDSSKPTMIPKRLIDASLAEEILGFKAKTSLKDGIIKTVKWYKKNKIKH